MKFFAVWVFVFVVVFVSDTQGGLSMSSDGGLAHHKSQVEVLAKSRKVQEIINLEDYRPIDPSPSSKASIRHGPIQHGTPLMPYIPRPSPPKPSPPPTHCEIP